MTKEQIVKSTCGICNCGCGVLVYLEDGRPIKIKGDLAHPVNQGVLCAKGLASLEYLYHPDRLTHPMRRVGESGAGKWQQVSWDEALNSVAEELTKTKNRYGVESVLFMRGGTRGVKSDYLTRFANAFGTPNISSMASVCAIPHARASMITYGSLTYFDCDSLPSCILVWGSNINETCIGRYKHVNDALNKGSKLIVIDPLNIGLTQRADLWLKLRPGSDLALALGMLNVIVNEGLYDRDFVEKWTVGFEELKAHVQNYPPEKVAEITWIDAASIREASRLYATNKPAYIQWGNGFEHNINGFQTARALALLRAITGNLAIPGGEVTHAPLPTLSRSSAEFSLVNEIPAEVRAKRISANDRLLPMNLYALPQSIIKSILEEDPYPIRAIYVMAGNNLISFSNTPETYQAFNKLDFLVVTDMFMTPTASMADIVFPAATYLEYNSMREARDYPIALVQQKVAQIGECRSDYEILSGLAKRLGIERFFWDTEEQCVDYLLKPIGLTFDEFRKVGIIPAAKRYKDYEANDFATPSGKVEIYSSQLKDWGFDPLPVYYEPPETAYSAPESAREYPLVLTSFKSELFRHTEGRQIPALRNSRPEPITIIHPETASKLGITEGDWVYIETKRGKIKQKANLSDKIDPRVVVVDYGWWFPEKKASSLFGYAESNINMLTDNKPPYGHEMGTANLRGMLCKVYTAQR